MSGATEVIVPAREGRGVYMRKGQLLDIVDVEGHQVGDLIAWFRNDPSEYLSPTHTVSCNASIELVTGSQVFSNRRNPVFTIVRDDVERHDIIVPCCDHERFKRDYDLDDHDHCLANLYQARDLLGEDFELTRRDGLERVHAQPGDRRRGRGDRSRRPRRGRHYDPAGPRGSGGAPVRLPPGPHPVQRFQPHLDAHEASGGLVVCLRNNRVLWRPSASRRCVPLPQRTAAGTPSSAGLARNTAADARPHRQFTDRPLDGTTRR